MKNLLSLVLVCGLVACGSDSKTESADTTTPATPEASEAAAVAVEITEEEHNVICGCKIDSVGRCGNYIEFDGEFAQITNSKEVGLGGMEWCSSSDDRAIVSGTRTGSEFVATKVQAVE